MGDRIVRLVGAVIWGMVWTVCLIVCCVFLPLDLLMGGCE